MEANQWDERYRAGSVWSGEPNESLVALVEGLPVPAAPPAESLPRALDLGCGEGADALWLAGHGWEVVGVDWSGVAVDRARTAADALRSRATFVQGDARDASWLASLSPSRDFDLITASYVHPEPAERQRTFAHLARLLGPGGHLIVLAHAPEHGLLGLGGPPQDRLLSTADVIDALGLWESDRVVLSETRSRELDGLLTAVDTVVLVSAAVDPVGPNR